MQAMKIVAFAPSGFTVGDRPLLYPECLWEGERSVLAVAIRPASGLRRATLAPSEAPGVRLVWRGAPAESWLDAAARYIIQNLPIPGNWTAKVSHPGRESLLALAGALNALRLPTLSPLQLAELICKAEYAASSKPVDIAGCAAALIGGLSLVKISPTAGLQASSPQLGSDLQAQNPMVYEDGLAVYIA